MINTRRIKMWMRDPAHHPVLLELASVALSCTFFAAILVIVDRIAN